MGGSSQLIPLITLVNNWSRLLLLLASSVNIGC